MHTTSLNGTWQLYYFPQHAWTVDHPEDLRKHRLQPIAARVPGNVELDLLDAGQIPDPYAGSNITELRKYELYEWWYETGFEAPGQQGRTELVFHGVDCLATYWLNGEPLGESGNMLIEHRFDVTRSLRPGRNELHIRLRSPILDATEREFTPAMWAAGQGNWAQLWSRKAAHSYGWDIMPRAVSAGLWRSVELVVHEETAFQDVYLFTRSAGSEHADIGVYYQVRVDPALPGSLSDSLTLRVEGTCGGSSFHQEERVMFTAGMIDIPLSNPQLWWPRGYGKAHLYEVTLTLLHNGAALARRTDTMGIRTVQLQRSDITSTENPGQFQFVVNGVPIFCKGANWVPADMFHSKDESRIPAILDLFADMNCSIVRVWGGSVYEDHAFFDRCDREGFMVWQDFSYACGFYPQSEAFFAIAREEARSVVRKLRNHPSLALWCGDNENDIFRFYRGIPPSRNRLTREVLPRIVEQYDPYRPYLESSPYVSDEVWKRNNIRLLPEDHLWGPRDYYKSRYYASGNMHFISEIGYHGCPSADSIRRFIDADRLWPWRDNEQWAYHSSDPAGLEGEWARRIELMANQVKELFGEVPDNLEDFALASQISQAEAKKYFVEMMRIRKGQRTGIIWWNMIDGWPQFSDAVVDYYFGKKLAFHYLKRVHQDVCVMIDEPSDWHVQAVVSNDTLVPREGRYRIRDADSGETLLEGAFQAPANGNATLGQIRISHSDQRLFLIEWQLDGVSYLNHYLLGFPAFSLAAYRKWLTRLQLPPDFQT